MKDLGLKVAGVIFLLVSLAHLARVALKVPVTMGTFDFQLRYSVAAFLVSLCLALWLFSLLKKSK
jgi:hypothetical protein